MNFLRDLPVLVLGLGDSGLAMVRWCVRHGAAVTVWDTREMPPQAQTLRGELPQVMLTSGPASAPPAVDAFRLVLKSPGLSPHDPRVVPVLRAARDSGIALLGELDLFGHALHDLRTATACAGNYAPKLIAITGTNGKTTTTAMTARLAERCGKTVATAGNIGPTMLDTLAAALDTGTLPEVWVLELSSFQLEGGGFGLDAGAHFAPDAAVVLNLSQDHLDWHGSMKAYAAAKARLYAALAAEGTMVLNRDDAQVMAMQPAPPAPAAAKASRLKPVERRSLHIGLGAPQRAGDFGLVTENGMAWLVRALPSEEPVKRRKAGAEGGHDEEALHLQRMMPADALRVRGRHNAANALAALALASAIGCPLAPMLHGLREYTGEPHRLQWIATVDGVEALDDSKGTNVGATVAALQGLGADKAPGRIVVILGGDGKGQDFTPLAAPLSRHARAVATIGRDADAIEAVIGGVRHQRFAALPEAVVWCFEQAEPGDAVLLSPACASLDMFRNYAHRAEVFVQAVQAVAAERGVVA